MSKMEIFDTQCEYEDSPVGIDTINPVFSWKAACGGGKGIMQTAYRIKVYSSPGRAESDDCDVWDSGRIYSGQSAGVAYKGTELKSRTIYYWKVTAWYSNNCVSASYTGSFETAFLKQDDWKAKWIRKADTAGKSAPMFRKDFAVKGNVSCARAYVTGLGYYELRLNGRKVGDRLLDPGVTDYRKTILYSTYKVEEYLETGINAVSVILGNGWYQDKYLSESGPASLKFLLQIEIYYSNGTSDCIVSDIKSGWKATASGPIAGSNSIYNGEKYDARLEIEGWDIPGYDCAVNSLSDHAVWEGVLLAESPGGKLKSQMMEPIKAVDEIIPLCVTEPKAGVFVFDLGQNIAGWARLKVKGTRGTAVMLKYSEILYPDGLPNRENLSKAAACDTYILKGVADVEEVFEPRFTYHGFRYVQVEGFPGVPDKGSITGVVAVSAVKKIMDFETGNDLINRIQKCVLWTEKDNLHSIPTDCPQRSERLGWMNDMTVRAEEAVYNYNMERLYSKWVGDMKDAQGRETGAIPSVVPFYRFGNMPADPLCGCLIMIPELLNAHYGDSKIVAGSFESMERWFRFLEMHADNNIMTYSHYGDWAAPVGSCIEDGGLNAISAVTPGALVSTVFYYYYAVLLAGMAEDAGDDYKYRDYAGKAEKIKSAFNKVFYNPEKGCYAKGSQASNTLALFFGLVPEEHREKVVDSLVKDVAENDYHLTTGNIGTRYLLEALTLNGKADVAYKLVTGTTYPSWGYMLEKGATTIWERWEYRESGRMCSHNHPMNATVGVWFYKYLAGIIPDRRNNGFGKFIIKPYVIDDVGFTQAALDTVKGSIKVHWIKESNKFVLKVIIPCNSVCDIHIPVFGRNMTIGESLSSSQIYSLARIKSKYADSERLHQANPDYPDGIDDIRMDMQEAIITTGSGEYSFICTW